MHMHIDEKEERLIKKKIKHIRNITLSLKFGILPISFLSAFLEAKKSTFQKSKMVETE